jgi:arabinose-5-phosphate isomerase
MGKSGHIARKLAATFASTGTPAYFVHPAEASHGDLGMVTGDDVFLALSYSGESDELMAILPVLRRLGTRIIALTGNAQSSLAREADIVLDGSVAREACPHNRQPPAPRPLSHWVTPWPSRCWKREVSVPKILPCHTPAARWVGAC